MRPLLSLCMMVRDESASLRRALDLALPHVDRGTIIDTGSIDGTQRIVREAFVAHNKPLLIWEEAFDRYDTTRNRVLELDAAAAEAAVFQFMLSGDEFLRNGPALRAELEQLRGSSVDLYKIRLEIDNTQIYQPRVFRTGSPWRYHSDLPLGLHEFPAHPNEGAAVGTLETGAWIEHIVADAQRRLNNIWDVHIPALRAHLDDNPDDARALLCLAESYEALLPTPGFSAGERVSYAMQAMSLYLRRFALPFAQDAERNFLRMRYLEDARMTPVYSPAELVSRATELYQADPKRPETALLLVRAAIAAQAPTVQIYALAVNAANVAAAAKSIPNDSPVSLTCGWQAHHIAATVAKRLAEISDEPISESIREAMRPYAIDIPDGATWSTLMRSHVSAGFQAGGTWTNFASLMKPAAPKSSSPSAP